MKTIGIIPARMESERLPGKLLRSDTGKSLLQHTWENASRSKRIDHLVVATDSELIRENVLGFGGDVVFTGTHSTGTDRVAEAIRQFDSFDIVVNIQGDEPELPPGNIDLLIDLLLSCDANVATLASPIAETENVEDPNLVKVIINQNGEAIYFSRFPIPYQRNSINDLVCYQHIGVYAFNRDFLIEYASWPPSELEKAECLEQLRIVEKGCRVRVCLVDRAHPGIDTLKDYLDFVERQQSFE